MNEVLRVLSHDFLHVAFSPSRCHPLSLSLFCSISCLVPSSSSTSEPRAALALTSATVRKLVLRVRCESSIVTDPVSFSPLWCSILSLSLSSSPSRSWRTVAAVSVAPSSFILVRTTWSSCCACATQGTHPLRSRNSIPRLARCDGCICNLASLSRSPSLFSSICALPSTLVGFHPSVSLPLLFLSYACVERGSTISLCSLRLPFSPFVLPHPAARCSPFNHSALPRLEQHELLFLKAQLVLRVRRGNNLLPSPFRSRIPLPHFVLS